MLRRGTKLHVLRDDGQPDMLTVGYCGKQLAFIDRNYNVFCPAFYSQDDDMDILLVKSKEKSFTVIDMNHPKVVVMHPFLSRDSFSFISGYSNGDILVFCSDEEERYKTLKVTPKYDEHSLNNEIKKLYYDERLLHLATYRCLESPYFKNLDDLRQYGIWWIRDQVLLDPVLFDYLVHIRNMGYQKIVSEDRVYKTDYLFNSSEFFPLCKMEYSIDDLLENKVIAIFPEKWKGYQKFREEFCERGGCV